MLRRPRLLPVLRPGLSLAVAALLLLIGWKADAAGPAAHHPADGAAVPVLASASAGPPSVVAADPVSQKLEHVDEMPPAVQIVTIMVATLISEDLTCIAVGMMIHTKQIEWWVGGLACFLGIYVGDLLLFFAGRLFGKALLKLKFFSHGFGAAKLEEFGRWFERRPWAALAMCRVAPGLRMPLFLAVGALTKKTAVFFWWTCFFAFVWTPVLIGLVVVLGDVVVAPILKFFGGGWKGIVLTMLLVFVTIRVVTLLATREGRLKIIAKWDKLIGKEPAEEPLTDPGSSKHVAGVEPVMKPTVLPEAGK